jgi:OOP family OmpA-OmpF porin
MLAIGPHPRVKFGKTPPANAGAQVFGHLPTPCLVAMAPSLKNPKPWSSLTLLYPNPEVNTAPVIDPSTVPAAAPAPAPAPAAAPAAAVSSKVTYAADAFFDFDKSVIKPDGKAKLDDLVSKVKAINLEVIIAVGHTDSVGSDAYNQKLSLRRAQAVKAYLVSKGIDKTRIYTEGKGEKQPVADNKTKEGRAKNRRVEIEVVGSRKN